MDSSTLKMFLTVVLEFFKPKLPGWAYALVKSVLDKLLADFVPTIGAAPDSLKDWVKQYLLEYAAKIPYPLVSAVVTRVIKTIDGAVLDFLWDLAMARLLGQPAVMMAIPFHADLTLDDLVDVAAA